MAFLIITDSIDKTIKHLKEEIEKNKTIYKLTNDPEYFNKLRLNEDKLKTAIKYKKLYDKKSEYSKIAYLKHIDVDKYKKKCREFAKKLKGVWFDPQRLLFRVQITRKGERIYLGYYNTPDDALEVLQNYI